MYSKIPGKHPVVRTYDSVPYRYGTVRYGTVPYRSFFIFWYGCKIRTSVHTYVCSITENPKDHVTKGDTHTALASTASCSNRRRHEPIDWFLV